MVYESTVQEPGAPLSWSVRAHGTEQHCSNLKQEDSLHPEFQGHTPDTVSTRVTEIYAGHQVRMVQRGQVRCGLHYSKLHLRHIGKGTWEGRDQQMWGLVLALPPRRPWAGKSFNCFWAVSYLHFKETLPWTYICLWLAASLFIYSLKCLLSAFYKPWSY